MSDRTITVKKDGKELKLIINKPTRQQKDDAQVEFNKTFRAAQKAGAVFRFAMDAEMKKQGLWDDERQKELENLLKELRHKEYLAWSGGIKKSEAKKLCLEIRQLRKSMNELTAPKLAADSNTVEGQAENSKFNYLVYACTKKEDGTTYWPSYQDYLDDNSEIGTQAAHTLSYLLFGLSENMEKELTENKVLAELGMVDDKLRLVDDKGRLINEDGKLIREDGRLVNEEGELINMDGFKVDEDGNLLIERKPYLDD